MVAYQDFVALSRSPDSEERGTAAHLAARAYLGHTGPADEQAALYAALFGFLDDPSVKVRAALAYGLLHSLHAPRPLILALLNDSAIIARAVLQYSPVLLDADLLGLVPDADLTILAAIAARDEVSPRLISALLGRGERGIVLTLLARPELLIEAGDFAALAAQFAADAPMRGALLSRRDLPGSVRLQLVQAAVGALREARIVKGALAPERLERVLRDGLDTALSVIGEQEAHKAQPAFVAQLVEGDSLNTRILLHAVVTGHVMFFADCLAELAQTGRGKVFGMLERGSRAALGALLARAGLNAGVADLVVRLILHARQADLADDAPARHYVVTVLTEELIAEHEGKIPPELEEAFRYLSEQNIMLARKAARGVMGAFAQDAGAAMALPGSTPMLALSAA